MTTRTTLFALALAGLGVVSLATGTFAYLWQPAPSWSAGHAALAFASGALLIACGAGLLWARTRGPAALALAGYGLASMLLVHAPRIASKPQVEAQWFGLGEVAIVVAGAWILFVGAAASPASRWARALASERGLRHARRLFGLALIPFGLSHFVYSDVTAALVPSWLPGHVGWAYSTGAAHLAAGIAILVGLVPRLAATLEGLMVSLFVLTIHVPLVLGSPRSRDQWTELFVAGFIAGAAFLVAGTYRGLLWLAMGWSRRA